MFAFFIKVAPHSLIRVVKAITIPRVRSVNVAQRAADFFLHSER
jgi:hypothetical protein